MDQFSTINQYVTFELPDNWLSLVDKRAKSSSAGKQITEQLGPRAYEYWVSWHKILLAAAVKPDDFNTVYEEEVSKLPQKEKEKACEIVNVDLKLKMLECLESVHSLNFLVDIWNGTHLPVPYCLPLLQAAIKFFVKKGILTEFLAILFIMGLSLTAVKNPYELQRFKREMSAAIVAIEVENLKKTNDVEAPSNPVIQLNPVTVEVPTVKEEETKKNGEESTKVPENTVEEYNSEDDDVNLEEEKTQYKCDPPCPWCASNSHQDDECREIEQLLK